jgi:hypothetical protein
MTPQSARLSRASSSRRLEPLRHIDAGVASATDGSAQATKFTGPRTHRVILRAGHNLPQEEPGAFAASVMELVKA